jgi:hypothetical protein
MNRAAAEILLRLAIVSSIGMVNLCGQSSNTVNRTSELLSPNRLPPYLNAAYRALGSRLTTKGKERVTAVGAITDISGTRPVQLTWQTPGVFRFEEAGQAGRVITFNGSQLAKSKGNLAEEDRRVVESLFLDSAETLFQTIDSGAGVRKIGSRFREDDGTARVYNGRYLDYYQVFPISEKKIPETYMHIRFVAFDSQTQLLAKVWYEERGQRVETEFINWQRAEGEAFPREVVRREAGREVLRLRLDRIETGGKAPDAHFAN